jgi:tetratricopeptide (TPR) repeat protein
MINNSTYNLGHTYFEEGKYKNAINCFNKITESLINANQNLGTSYFYIKDYANAIYFWKKYIARLEAINSDENIEEIERVKDYIEQAKEKLVENGNLQQNTNQLNLKPTKRGGLTKDPNFKLK